MARQRGAVQIDPAEASLVFGSAIALAAFLLFACEPLAAKQLLPRFGGSSSVWITALLFFQTDLLLGYLYARLLATLLPAKARTLHLVVLACAAASALLTLSGAALSPTAQRWALDHPALMIFALFTRQFGLPFFLLASASPLLQLWHARAVGAGIPYRFYAVSNVGSLLALLAYPVLVEPWLTLQLQKALWTAGFLLFVLLSVLLTLRVSAFASEPKGAPTHPPPSSPIRPRQRLLWVLLPFGAAVQLSAVTAHLTANIAAIPLLWVLPLAAYLLTFIVAFDRPQWYRRAVVVRLLVVLLASLGYLLSKTDVDLPIHLAISFFLLELFLACFFCHAELFALRPEAERDATAFYVCIALGGAAGTCFVALVSPLLFAANYDLALSFLFTAILAVFVTWKEGWPQRLLWLTSSVLLAGLLGALHVAYTRNVLFASRNFYGSLRVKQELRPDGVVVRTLLHGTIQHGTQIFGNDRLAPEDPGADRRRDPTTYYGPDSGIGLVLNAGSSPAPRRIGVVGLGAGTLAAYGRAGDAVTFLEINPLVPPIARNLFTYLRDSQANIQILLGDARATLATDPERFDLLAIDAFSGDAVPLHLLTTQAIAIYRDHLTPTGLLAFHISNQYVDLAPEIDLQAQAAGLTALLVETKAAPANGTFAASWVILGTPDRLGKVPDLVEHSRQIAPHAGLRLWTDDFSSLLPLLR